LLVVIAIQQKTLDSVRLQIDAQTRAVQEIKKSNTDSLDIIKRRIDCLAVYFAQRDRAELTIDDIDRCTIRSNETITEVFNLPTPPPAATSNNPSNASSSPPASSTRSTPPPAVAVAPPAARPPSPTPTPVTPPPTPGPPSPTPPPQNTMQPVNLLGVPICIPVLQLCVAR
jgi:hypothetical protein